MSLRIIGAQLERLAKMLACRVVLPTLVQKDRKIVMCLCICWTQFECAPICTFCSGLIAARLENIGKRVMSYGVVRMLLDRFSEMVACARQLALRPRAMRSCSALQDNWVVVVTPAYNERRLPVRC